MANNKGENNQSKGQAAIGSWGVDLSAGDRSVSPGADFFRFANGNWVDKFELPADEPSFGSFHLLRDKADEHLRTLVDEVVANQAAATTIEQGVAHLYRSYMDQASVDALGVKPICETLENIHSISSRKALLKAFANAKLDGTYSPIGWSVGADPRNPDRQLLRLGYQGLSLPDRDYYLLDNAQFETVREKFLQHVAEMFAFVGADNTQASDAANAILALETALAAVHWSRSDERDVDKTYNLYSLKSLQLEFAGFDWVEFFASSGLPVVAECNVTVPSAINPLLALIKNTPLAHWRALLTYKLIVNNADFLSDDVGIASFNFYGRVLSGQPARRVRWKRGINFVSSALSDAVGELYVARHFPPEAKAQIDVLVANVTQAFAGRIESNAWMSEETRSMARKKLDTFIPKIGYPQKWTNYESLEIIPDELYGNVCRLREFQLQEQVADLLKPTDRSKWFMSPQTVNAYYAPLFNEIVFPAAILQPPFFDPAADPAVNYGGIGAIIGHEMGHGFDDQGRKYNHLGVLQNWWQSEDVERFTKRTNMLVEQFNSYQLLPDMHVDGQFTLGENIGDLGGLTLGYAAYRLSLNGREAPVIDGLSGDQRFFLAYAQVWKNKSRDEYAITLLKSDPHSPPEFRVNGAIRNVDAWYEAFDIDSNSKWYLPPEERVRIW